MRIALITSYYEEKYGGNEYYLSKFLSDMGHEVKIYVTEYSIPRYGKIKKVDEGSSINNVEVVSDWAETSAATAGQEVALDPAWSSVPVQNRFVNPVTNINYEIPKSSNISLVVYDLLGNEVESLVKEKQVKGNYSVVFDAKKLTSGVYFYKLSSDEKYHITKKMIILKWS